MKIVTNPGSNLPPRALDRYGVLLTPQTIVVDGDAHDTRNEPIDAFKIDGWVSSAKVHPYVVGTTAAEFVAVFKEAATTERRILAVMTSRKIIGSYDAAISAAKTLRSIPGHEDITVDVADTGVTDLGAGLATMLAGECARAGRSVEDLLALLETYRKSARFVFTVRTLDYLVKGGRATPLRAWLANLLKVRPLIGFTDGELGAVGKIKAHADDALELAGCLAKDLGDGRRVLAAVAHGAAPEAAARLVDEMSKRLDVVYMVTRTLSPSIYLHAGPGSLCAIAVPVDAFPFAPPTLPSFG